MSMDKPQLLASLARNRRVPNAVTIWTRRVAIVVRFAGTEPVFSAGGRLFDWVRAGVRVMSHPIDRLDVYFFLLRYLFLANQFEA